MSLGVEAIEIRLSSNEASREYLEKIIDGLKGTGLELHEIMLEDVYNSTSAALDRPQWEADLEFFKRFIRDLGGLRVPHTTYAWHTRDMYETHRDKTRGVTSRGFSTAPA